MSPTLAPLSLKHLLSLRTLLVTGKGGVGKTTVSAALARWLSEKGRRVLITELGSEDAKSSALADALGVEGLRDEPVAIGPNLSAAALAPSIGHQRFLRDVLPLKLLADVAMKTGAIRRFLAAAPTFPEMGVLYRLLDLVRMTRSDGSPRYESIIVDLPATGHALALAQIPASLLRVVTTGPIARAVEEGLDLLMDPKRTGAIVVTLPETLPVSEALELVAGIHEHQIPLAHVFVNRVPFDPFEGRERDALSRILDGRPKVLGERTLERIDRARLAIERVRHAVEEPVATLHDVWVEGPRLTEEMASLLALGDPP
jgi:arsenite/tail-anchored protein-transporting ATPase